QPLLAGGGLSGHYIDGFAMGDIDNLNSGATNIPGYANFSYSDLGFQTVVAPGNTYQATITSGPDGLFDYYMIWVDLDRDGHYASDELVGSSVSGTPGPSQTVVDVAIPLDAQGGYTGMRVLCVNGAPPVDPCGVYSFGEAEDYTLVIDDGTGCMPRFFAQGSDGDYVAAVQLNDLYWVPTITPPVWGYENSLEYGAHLEGGVTSQLTVTKGPFDGPDNVFVWIDWYNDGFDPSDLVAQGTITDPDGSITLDITPPNRQGYARMRIACMFDSMDNNDPCGEAEYGTAADFTLAIGHVGWPCMPLLGNGTRNGDGFSTVTVEGDAYNGMQTFPYANGTANRYRYDAGSDVNVGALAGSQVPENFSVMLDMNDDDDFADAGEVLGSYATGIAYESFLIPAIIPADCPPGQHFMRLRCNAGAAPLNAPCQDTFEGSTFDVLVVVQDPQGPCIPAMGQWTIFGHYIDGVQLGSIQNTGTGAAWGPSYHAYPLSTDLLISASDTLTMYSGTQSGDDFAAWIDYNADNDFDDANEALGVISIPSAFTPGQLIFTVPNGTTPGPKRLRVRTMPAGESDPCADASYGETEDYTVVISLNTGIASTAAPSVSVLNATDGLVLVGDASCIGTGYTLRDATGRAVMSGRMTSDRVDVPMLEYARGTYLVELNTGEARSIMRAVW
ncbi:MAG: GEVED domain-containing protein, partial [Flavobacteriales bacterium]